MAGRILLIGYSFLLSCTLFFSSCEEVTVSLVSDALKVTFCPGEVATFTCRTSGGALLWETSTTSDKKLIRSITDGPANLGIFRLTVDGARYTPGAGQTIVEAVNSSATTLVGVRPADDGIRLGCRQATNFTLDEITLRVTGPPPAPAVNPITVVDKGSINSTLLISWSESNCAVQYVVTIINSSDDRVYPNFTTSNTNTTVTLPTGVEFCVTLVAVDSIGRRGQDTTPVCYQFSNVLSTATTTILQTASSATTTALLSPSVLVGDNVPAAAVAVPVVLVVLLLMIGVVVLGMGLCIYLWKKRNPKQYYSDDTVPLSSIKNYKTVEVFCREVDVNQWEIACVVGIPEKNIEFLNIIKEHLEKDKFTAYTSYAVEVDSVDENVYVSIQNVNEGWNTEEAQDIQLGDITDRCETKFTTKTFMVSSSQFSPDDMCVTMTIFNGGQTPSTVTVERKASKRCGCQVFYCKEGINCWKITFAFFPDERMYSEVKELYNDLEAGPTVYFYINWYEPETVDLNYSCETDWCIVEESKAFQVSRAAILEYTGKSSPPSCEMAFKAVSDTTKAPDLSLAITFNGVKKQNRELKIERPGEVPAWYVCQVFYHMDNVNNWEVTLAFWHKKNFNLFEMKKFFQNEEIGPVCDIRFNSAVIMVEKTDGSEVVASSQPEVQKKAIIGYNGKDKPPCIVMTLRAVSDEATPPDLQSTITLSGVDGVIKLSMIRKTQ